MKNSGLQILEIELTTRCNLNCKHCYVNKKNQIDLPNSKIISLIKEAKKLNVYRIVFTGGEPLLCKKLFAYASLAKKLKINQVMMMTNGLLITEENIRNLKVFDLIQLSFDSLPGKTPRFRVDYTKDLEKKIALLKKHHIQISLQATIHKSLLPEIKNIAKFAEKTKIKIGFNRLSAVGNATKLQNELLQPKELRKALTKISKLKQTNHFIGCSDPLLFLVDNNKMELFKSQPKRTILGGCIAGVSTLYIAANQDIYICPFVRKKIDSIKNKKMSIVWEKNKVLEKLRERDYSGKCGKCEYKSYCGGCRASSLTNENTLLGSDKNCFKTD
ncbi:MAG: radical SAM protein [archaeon]